MSVVKRILVGRPLSSDAQAHQKLSKTIALPIFSSDAISSTAYATEEILFVTALGASSLILGLDLLIPIAIGVAILLTIVVTSYRQTIFAYPSGGGSYVVSRENLGEMPALVAAASLLVDYILTVAVSVAAGVAAIISIPAFRDLADRRVEMGLVLIGLVTLANLRGIKESGRIFAVPTYLYILILTVLVGYGLYESFWGDLGQVPFDEKSFEGVRKAGGDIGLFLILKGFSSGAVALTGVEAISNGVPQFKRPESKNAAATLVMMAAILGVLFLGVSVLAHRVQPFPSHEQTVFSQMGLLVFGDSAIYLVLQFATAAVLVLAANTAYAGFPSLSSIIARDGYLPRQLATRGDRLVFSNGVLLLAGAAAILIVAFGGITTNLIPLYAVGVFTSFTLSQAGMVRHHQRVREPRWKFNAFLNGLGAVTTMVVVLIVAVTKFKIGAWIPIVVIPFIILLFKSIHSHYATVEKGLATEPGYRARPMNHTVVVLVGTVHRGVLEALAYAKSIRPNQLLAVTVVSNEEEQERIARKWADFGIDVPLEIVFSPYRELARPVLRFVGELDAQRDNDIVTVIIPEFVVGSWWGQLLHNQSALFLKGRLLFRKGTVVTSVPYHI